MNRLLACGIFGLLIVVVHSYAVEDETTTAEALRKKGVYVVQDETKPDKPVVRIRMSFIDPNELKTIIELNELTRVELSDNWYGKEEKDFPKFKFSPRLTRLELEKPRKKFLANIDLKDYPRLEKLVISSANDVDSLLEPIATLKELKVLDLSNTNVSSSTMKRIATAKTLTFLSLERSRHSAIELETSRLTKQDFKQLGQLPKLEVLRLSGTQIDSIGIAEIAKLTELRELELDSTGITDADLKTLSTLTNLTKLSLRKTKITHEAIKEIAKLSNLTILEIGHNKIDPKEIVELKKLTKLTCLDISSTEINDESIKHICQMKTLTSLYIANAKVSDRCIPDLLKLSNLAVIDLFQTTITFSGVRDLSELKGLKIVLSGENYTGNLGGFGFLSRPREFEKNLLPTQEVGRGVMHIYGREVQSSSQNMGGSFGAFGGNFGFTVPKYGHLPR